MGCPRPTNPDGSYMRPSNVRDIGELSNERQFRDRIYTMCYDAPGKGLVPNSLYRDPGRQWDIRAERVGVANACNPKVKAYPATAVPPTWNGSEWVGGSNHCKRKAADLMGRAQGWANANCHRYGLFLAVSTEDWHYEATSYAPTVRILRYPGPTYDQTTDPEEFIMDAEAKAAFAALNDKIDTRFGVLTSDLVREENRGVGIVQRTVAEEAQRAASGVVTFLATVNSDIEERQREAAAAYMDELRSLDAKRTG